MVMACRGGRGNSSEDLTNFLQQLAETERFGDVAKRFLGIPTEAPWRVDLAAMT